MSRVEKNIQKSKKKPKPQIPHGIERLKEA